MVGGSELESQPKQPQSYKQYRPHPDLFMTSVESPLFDTVVVLDRLPDTGPGDNPDGDELFLLPDRVLGMDSISFRDRLHLRC
jgi:hypothetical protein